MSNIKSTVAFTSNLWPYDSPKDFWDHIYDPEAISALDKECRKNSLNGYSVEEERKCSSMPCALNNKFVFGTRLINGKKELVCICEDVNCKHYQECKKYKEK